MYFCHFQLASACVHIRTAIVDVVNSRTCVFTYTCIHPQKAAKEWAETSQIYCPHGMAFSRNTLELAGRDLEKMSAALIGAQYERQNAQDLLDTEHTSATRILKMLQVASDEAKRIVGIVTEMDGNLQGDSDDVRKLLTSINSAAHKITDGVEQLQDKSQWNTPPKRGRPDETASDDGNL
jgi:hypothetical protein